MDELHGDRTFSDSRCNSLHGSVANIADRKKPGDICFEQERVTVERPAFGARAFSYQVRAGQDEAVFVALDGIGKPISAWGGADENEHGVGWYAIDVIGVRAQERNPFQMRFAMDFGDACVWPDLNVWCFVDLVN